MSIRKPLLTALLFLIQISIASAFAEPVPLVEQVKRADAILRVVVVSKDELASEEGRGFQAMAKCRVIADYKGDYRLGQFIYIPCSYNYDPSPSPVDVEGDYVVMLDTLETASIGHPVSWDAVHEIRVNKLQDLDDAEKTILLEDLVKHIKEMLADENRKKTDPDGEGKE